MLFKQCLCPCHSSTRVVYSISITLCKSSKSRIILFDRLIPTQVRLFSLELKYLFFSILIFDLLPLFQVLNLRLWLLELQPKFWFTSLQLTHLFWYIFYIMRSSQEVLNVSAAQQPVLLSHILAFVFVLKPESSICLFELRLKLWFFLLGLCCLINLGKRVREVCINNR